MAGKAGCYGEFACVFIKVCGRITACFGRDGIKEPHKAIARLRLEARMQPAPSFGGDTSQVENIF